MSQVVTLEPISNQEDWDETFELFDTETGEALDMTAVTAMTLILWDADQRTILLRALLDDGITIENATGGIVSMHFDASAIIAALSGDVNYPFRLNMVNGGATKDLILGMLPVVDGGPT
jgi:hypothetical protein